MDFVLDEQGREDFRRSSDAENTVKEDNDKRAGRIASVVVRQGSSVLESQILLGSHDKEGEGDAQSIPLAWVFK